MDSEIGSFSLQDSRITNENDSLFHRLSQNMRIVCSFLTLEIKPESSPAGLVLEIEIWRHIDTKQKSK